ncbi:MAG: hypothetical protein AAFV93_19255 [Chloroflexota bacterium]
MQYSDEIKRACVRGHSDGKHLLQRIAIESLQEVAGYTPPTLPDSVYMRHVTDERPVTPSRSTSQLYRMLLGDFQFGRCLPEWCLLVAEQGMRIPSELIPAMLNSRELYVDWRDVALLVMGSYARWIVAHQRKMNFRKISEKMRWDWVMQTSPPTVEGIYQTIKKQSQDKIQEYERARNISTFHNSLTNYQFFWSDELSELILRHVDYLISNVASDHWRLDIYRIHLCFAYYAPLKYHESYSLYLKNMREMQITNLDITEITRYRQKLHHIIIADAKQVQHTLGEGR